MCPHGGLTHTLGVLDEAVQEAGAVTTKEDMEALKKYVFSFFFSFLFVLFFFSFLLFFLVYRLHFLGVSWIKIRFVALLACVFWFYFLHVIFK